MAPHNTFALGINIGWIGNVSKTDTYVKFSVSRHEWLAKENTLFDKNSYVWKIADKLQKRKYVFITSHEATWKNGDKYQRTHIVDNVILLGENKPSDEEFIEQESGTEVVKSTLTAFEKRQLARLPK
jgi:hypothetical protein